MILPLCPYNYLTISRCCRKWENIDKRGNDRNNNFLEDTKIICHKNNVISKKNIIFAVVYTYVIWKLKN